TGGTSAGHPSGWIGVRPLAVQRVWDDLPVSAARRGTPPRGSWAGRHEAERDGSEQGPLRATRRQLDTNARDVLDHARPDLDQALSDRGELTFDTTRGFDFLNSNWAGVTVLHRAFPAFGRRLSLGRGVR